MSRVAIWSSVILSCFRTENATPTSSDVRSYFEYIKTIEKYSNKRISLDEFIIKYRGPVEKKRSVISLRPLKA